MPHKSLRWILLALAAFLTVAPPARGDQPAGPTVHPDARFEGVSTDQVSADFVILPQMTPQHFLVRDVALQDELKALHKGDRLSVMVAADNGQTVLQMMSVRVAPVGRLYRALVLVVVACVFWVVCFLLSGFHPQRLIMGEDGRFSNSKFQTVLWFGVLMISYLAALWLRVHEFGGDMLGGINIPPNILLLSGVSAITFTAAKGITVAKIENARAAGVVNSKPMAAVARFWADLTSNDNNMFDLGDFQMLIMTFLAVGTFLALIFHFLGSLEARTIVYLPDVDTTVLASFGLGHGAYLTKKAVGNLGDT